MPELKNEAIKEWLQMLPPGASRDPDFLYELLSQTFYKDTRAALSKTWSRKGGGEKLIAKLETCAPIKVAMVWNLPLSDAYAAIVKALPTREEQCDNLFGIAGCVFSWSTTYYLISYKAKVFEELCGIVEYAKGIVSLFNKPQYCSWSSEVATGINDFYLSYPGYVEAVRKGTDLTYNRYFNRYMHFLPKKDYTHFKTVLGQSLFKGNEAQLEYYWNTIQPDSVLSAKNNRLTNDVVLFVAMCNNISYDKAVEVMLQFIASKNLEPSSLLMYGGRGFPIESTLYCVHEDLGSGSKIANGVKGLLAQYPNLSKELSPYRHAVSEFYHRYASK